MSFRVWVLGFRVSGLRHSSGYDDMGPGCHAYRVYQGYCEGLRISVPSTAFSLGFEQQHLKITQLQIRSRAVVVNVLLGFHNVVTKRVHMCYYHYGVRSPPPKKKNHNHDGLLGPYSTMLVYMDPLGKVPLV